ncbi:MAG: alpha/beta hydrolase [Acidimicrobiia bacterium]|nr:alpha/beta hydrolase [Acidimicrobiia bacterium]
MATTPRPVVLVHGAFHGAWCWAALQAELDRRGVPSFAVDLPGHGASLDPLTDLHGDAAAVAGVVARLDGAVLVGHSYGGAVISQADLGGRVSHLVYLSALTLDVGESPFSLMGTFPKRASGGEASGGKLFQRLDDGTTGANAALARATFYNTCSAEAAAAAQARLCPQRASTFKQEATRANWRETPSTFIRCLQDRAISVPGQDLLAARCGSVVDLDCDHSPFVCMPSELADLLVPLTR